MPRLLVVESQLIRSEAAIVKRLPKCLLEAVIKAKLAGILIKYSLTIVKYKDINKYN
jgi:hypothetical protein